MIGSFVFINIGMEQEREIRLSQKKELSILLRHQGYDGAPAPRLWYPRTLSLVGHQSLGARAP